MLRYACGFAHVDQGAHTQLIQDCPEHWNIQHTIKYSASKTIPHPIRHSPRSYGDKKPLPAWDLRLKTFAK